jgi:hypothetical protein
MLSIQKSPIDKTGLGYVAPPSDTPSTSRTVFVKPAVPEAPPTIEDKGKDKLNGDIPGTQKPPSIRRSPTCHHCGLSGHVRPQCSFLKAQKAKVKKGVPRQVNYGTRASGSSISSPLVSCTTAPGISASTASAVICTCES